MYTLRRMGRLWSLYAYLDVAWMLRDVGSFLSYAVADVLIATAGAIAALLLLAERFGGIGVWSRDQVNGLLETLFGYNVAFISRRIGRGQLDHILVQPQPLWLTLATEGFSPCAGMPILLPGLGLLVWGAWLLQLPVTVGWLALLVLNLAGSCAIVFWFSYAIGSLAFWAPRAAEEINSTSWRMVTQLRTFPLDGLAPALLVGMMTVVPVGFVAWYPARAMLGIETAPLAILATPLAAVVFSAIGVLIFRSGLTKYAQTGSQRYLDYGHRR